MRDNKNSTVFKCRHIIEVDGKKKECTGNFTLQSDRKTFKAKAHQHDRMEPIQSEIMVILSEIDQIILANPTLICGICSTYTLQELTILVRLIITL